MANLSNSSEPSQPRRKFFIWIGQLAAGFSLAGLGLDLLNPKVVQADPECTPCSGCSVVSCTYSGTCRVHDPSTPYEVGYRLYQGCTPPPCTLSQQTYYECSSSCTCYY